MQVRLRGIRREVAASKYIRATRTFISGMKNAPSLNDLRESAALVRVNVQVIPNRPISIASPYIMFCKVLEFSITFAPLFAGMVLKH